MVGLCESGIREVRMAVPPLTQIGRVADLALSDRGLVAGEGQDAVVAAADAAAADPSTPPAALVPLRDWLQVWGTALFGLDDRACVDIVPALSACTLLAELGVAGDAASGGAAVHVARQIGLRATVSQHLEPLFQLWGNTESRASDPDMWRRLGNLDLRARIPASAVDRIRTVDDALRHRSIRRSADVRLASACVAATVGAHVDYDEIVRGSSVLRTLAGIGRALVPRPAALLAQTALLPAQIELLHDLRRKAQVGTPLALLPVPAFLQDPGCARSGDLLHRFTEFGCTDQVDAIRVE